MKLFLIELSRKNKQGQQKGKQKMANTNSSTRSSKISSFRTQLGNSKTDFKDLSNEIADYLDACIEKREKMNERGGDVEAMMDDIGALEDLLAECDEKAEAQNN